MKKKSKLKPTISDSRKSSDEFLLNYQEAAIFLRMSVPWVKKNINELPHIKIGNRTKFRASSLRIYLDRKEINKAG